MAMCSSPLCLLSVSPRPPSCCPYPTPPSPAISILPRPHRRTTTAASASTPTDNRPFACTTTAFQGATVPNTWRYEFVIRSRKGKNVTDVPVPVPNPRPLPPPFSGIHSRHPQRRTPRPPRSLSSSPLPPIYLIEVMWTIFPSFPHFNLQS